MGGLAYDNQSYRKKARLSIKNYLENRYRNSWG